MTSVIKVFVVLVVLLASFASITAVAQAPVAADDVLRLSSEV
jgi:hypothetical protein